MPAAQYGHVSNCASPPDLRLGALWMAQRRTAARNGSEDRLAKNPAKSRYTC